MKIILTSNGENFPMSLQAKYLEAKNTPFVVYVYNYKEDNYLKVEGLDFNDLGNDDILALKDFGDSITNEDISLGIDNEEFFNPSFLDDDYRYDEVLIQVLEKQDAHLQKKYRMRVETIPPGERACIVENLVDDDENEEDILLEKDISWIVG